MPDALFQTWVVKAAHLQLTHLRNLKAYPERYVFRMEKLPASVVSRVQAMLAMIISTSRDDLSVASPLSCRSSSMEGPSDSQ
eukprot:5458077-Alexandrium_andersonii.AAC.1